MPNTHLTDSDLELAEEACRKLAERYRRDAERYPSPTIRNGFKQYGDEYHRLADRIKRFRETGAR